MTTTVGSAWVPPATPSSLTEGMREAKAYGIGPVTRVRLDGAGTPAQVRAALTRAWRLIGQPITVVVPSLPDPVACAAEEWAAEHAVAGIRVKYDTADLPQPLCVVIPADGPVPWCGCVEPPCARCWEADR